MRNLFKAAMPNLMKPSAFAIFALMAFSAYCAAQVDSPGGMRLKLTNDPGGPAPQHQLEGTWVGPVDRAANAGTPQFPPRGQQRFKLNKPEATFTVANTNDPVVRNCDPQGFPRNMLFEMR